jgi:hypothetical protein
MKNYTQSGIECHSLPEVYFVGCMVAEGRSIRRYKRAPLIYGGWREWHPDFIVDQDTIVEVKSYGSIAEVEELERKLGKDPTVRAKFNAHPHVRLVNGASYERNYESYVTRGVITGMREV